MDLDFKLVGAVQNDENSCIKVMIMIIFSLNRTIESSEENLMSYFHIKLAIHCKILERPNRYVYVKIRDQTMIRKIAA